MYAPLMLAFQLASGGSDTHTCFLVLNIGQRGLFTLLDYINNLIQ